MKWNRVIFLSMAVGLGIAAVSFSSPSGMGRLAPMASRVHLGLSKLRQQSAARGKETKDPGKAGRMKNSRQRWRKFSTTPKPRPATGGKPDPRSSASST